ncbi:MAG: hypothetical protein SNJ77_02660 [Cytophagales bacterium]
MTKISAYEIISLFIISLFSSCATIGGGSKYIARIFVKENPEAQIIIRGNWLDMERLQLK